jgi:Zn-dependent protease
LLKRSGRDILEDAFIGIMGPVFGTIGGLACVGIYYLTKAPFWAVLAYINFSINLFNLLPMAPLDGGWIVPVFSPKLLAAGIVLLFIVAPHNPMIWFLAILSIPRVIGAWTAKPETQPYFRVESSVRWRWAGYYLGLAAALALCNLLLTQEIEVLRGIA